MIRLVSFPVLSFPCYSNTPENLNLVFGEPTHRFPNTTLHLQPTPEKRKEKLYANFFPYGKLGSERPLITRPAEYERPDISKRGTPSFLLGKECTLCPYPTNSFTSAPAYLVFDTTFNNIPGYTFFYNISNVSILFLKKYAANSVLQKSVW